MTMITRVGFCPKCFKETRPKKGNFFITFGGTSNAFKAMKTNNGGRKGFTPHIYDFQRSVGKTIYYRKICCMDGCGAYLDGPEGKIFIYLNDDLWVDEYTHIDNWNSLVLFKDTGFKI